MPVIPYQPESRRIGIEPRSQLCHSSRSLVNPAIEQQATDRAYRIGQQQNVTVYHLIAQHTIEEKSYVYIKRNVILPIRCSRGLI